MHTSILDYLYHIEARDEVKILYAAESGSRAWGFASPDSDYDVRFLYSRPKDHYLTYNVERKRDVLEVPLDIEGAPWDVKGWDIRKVLHLFSKSNASLLEWMNSPITYIDPSKPITHLKAIGEVEFDPTALCYHYWSLGRKNASRFLENKDFVSLKKTLYVLRAFIATEWVEYSKSLPPVNFEKLLDQTAEISEDVALIAEQVRSAINIKRYVPESATSDTVLRPNLRRFIDKNCRVDEDRFAGIDRKDLRQGKWDDSLNRIFRRSISWAPA